MARGPQDAAAADRHEYHRAVSTILEEIPAGSSQSDVVAEDLCEAWDQEALHQVVQEGATSGSGEGTAVTHYDEEAVDQGEERWLPHHLPRRDVLHPLDGAQGRVLHPGAERGRRLGPLDGADAGGPVGDIQGAGPGALSGIRVLGERLEVQAVLA